MSVSARADERKHRQLKHSRDLCSFYFVTAVVDQHFSSEDGADGRAPIRGVLVPDRVGVLLVLFVQAEGGRQAVQEEEGQDRQRGGR